MPSTKAQKEIRNVIQRTLSGQNYQNLYTPVSKDLAHILDLAKAKGADCYSTNRQAELFRVGRKRKNLRPHQPAEANSVICCIIIREGVPILERPIQGAPLQHTYHAINDIDLIRKWLGEGFNRQCAWPTDYTYFPPQEYPRQPVQ